MNTELQSSLGEATLPEYTVQNLLTGQLDTEKLSQQIEALKNEITTIRYEMTLFTRKFANFSADTTPQRLYDDVSQQLARLAEKLQNYTAAYTKLVSLLQYSHDRLSREGNDAGAPALTPHTLDVLKGESSSAPPAKPQPKSLGNSAAKPISNKTVYD
ncbi:hypothetical protein BABINDRAFT_8502 [Babjeviella inositovora NRRL Y-12698]|uniref:Uncharacterized protein n=1 Tax=Babjeviella inositovora NRRL Y-12698 TaxID=984486 RepID=A0A1E3QRM7_9ASCO|nr:uncharacterized protein BABINDRAFT_8502 [Babjeviella inositovora NRRL Y-12698]ODQ79597.1 hypothetical protein BABINDRAFT_8502 [Babjeviella inositovora NRRL Y-12698]